MFPLFGMGGGGGRNKFHPVLRGAQKVSDSWFSREIYNWPSGVGNCPFCSYNL